MTSLVLRTTQLILHLFIFFYLLSYCDAATEVSPSEYALTRIQSCRKCCVEKLFFWAYFWKLRESCHENRHNSDWWFSKVMKTSDAFVVWAVWSSGHYTSLQLVSLRDNSLVYGRIQTLLLIILSYPIQLHYHASIIEKGKLTSGTLTLKASQQKHWDQLSKACHIRCNASFISSHLK